MDIVWRKFTLVSQLGLKGCNMLLGENVKEFFRRVAAITFEQAILRELESQEARAGKLQIGSGGVLSK